MTLDKVLVYFPKLIPLILVVGLVTGIYYYKYLNRLHRNLLFYLFLMFIADITSRFLAQTGNNHIVLLAYSFIEILGVSYFYYRFLLTKKHISMFVVNTIAMVYILWELCYYLFYNVSIKYFQPYAKIADNFVIILLALTFLYEKMNSYKESRWDNFRLNIAVLIFFTLNTLIFLPFNFLVNEKSGVKFYFWTGNVTLLLLFYSFLINEIWRNGRQNKLTRRGSAK